MSPPSDRPLRIAQVTPYNWGGDDEVNDFIACSSSELARRGHEIVVAAPGGSISRQRASRKAIGACRERPEKIGTGWKGERIDGDGPPVLSIGPGIPLPKGPKPRAAPLPLDVTRSLEELLSAGDFDLVHVHDPFAPSASSAALRHSWSLNVGSFHKPTERILSTQVARPLVEIFFGRMDARTASGAATAALMERFFGADYEIVVGAAEPSDDPYWPHSGGEDGRPLRIAYVASEERGALRMLVRALRRLEIDGSWEAAILVPDDSFALPRISRVLGERLRFLRTDDCQADELIASADVVCAASGGPEPAPSLVHRAFASGAVPITSHIDPYAELVEPSERGLMFPPGDEITLAAHIERLAGEPDLLERLRGRSRDGHRSWAEVADQLEAIYDRIGDRRHHRGGDEKVRGRLASRATIDCDLHMHTDHSHDCATPVEVLIETAKDRGMGAIAVTDHNEITGALAAREVAERNGGIKVIVGEE
ncbi:MAG: PHP domain-containing protein, partial [Solirubrobacterales bacterium]